MILSALIQSPYTIVHQWYMGFFFGVNGTRVMFWALDKMNRVCKTLGAIICECFTFCEMR